MAIQIDLPIEQLREFCRTNGIRRMSIFGSALRETFHSESDVDVLVEFKPETRTGLRFFAMQEELSRMLRRTVDLNTPNFLSPYFRKQAMREAEAVYDEE